MIVVASGISGTGEKKYGTALQELAKKHQLTLFEIGKTIAQPRLDVIGVCSFELSELLDIWEKPVAERLGL